MGHEEAEATAEEVKTLNEELQSTNEELVTLNEELEATVEELHTANEDLQARTSELTEVVASESEQRKAAEAARAHRGCPAERRGCSAHCGRSWHNALYNRRIHTILRQSKRQPYGAGHGRTFPHG